MFFKNDKKIYTIIFTHTIMSKLLSIILSYYMYY